MRNKKQDKYFAEFYEDKRSVAESEVANLCVCVWRLKMCNYCSTACVSRECDPVERLEW